MGSVRRRLGASAAAFLVPHSALAAVCDDLRPGWDGTPVTAWQELVFLFSTAPALALLLTSAVAVRLRSQWFALGVVVAWTILVSVITMADPSGLRVEAAQTGCVGSPTLFISIVAAICVAMIVYTAPSRAPSPPSEKD